MKAAIMTAIGHPLEVEDVELDAPADGEVHVRWRAAGVCHSDLSIFNGKLPSPVPAILGHEGAGVVVAAGANQAGFEPGDHVIGNFRPMCGRCYYCSRDQPYICERTMELTFGRKPWLRSDGSRAVGAVGGLGAFAEQAIVHEGALVKIPKHVPFEHAALVGCGVTTGVGAVLFAARVGAGDIVVVLGCGGVGQAVVQGARIARAGHIIAVDPNASRRAAAEDNGATRAVDPNEESVNDVVRMLTEGRGADFAFEVVGVPALQELAYKVTRPGGTTCWLGIPDIDASARLPSAKMVLQHKRVLGVIYGQAVPRRDMLTLIDYSESGQLDLDSMLSQRIGINDINDAFVAMLEGDVIRSVVMYGDE